ncbi:MAG: xanthine dehydrogenase family protein molybdopterin-binding subunit, partial [Candidatus Limnocylindrales bacterium]
MTAGRREDGPLLTGRATFVPDVELPGLLEVAFVRSPVAHARLAAVDTTAARTAPGVRFVAVAASLAGAGLFPDLVARARPVREPALCDQRVRYVGAPIAAIVADDRYLAEDAAELVVVEYEELTAVATIDDALRPDAPRLYEDWPDNRLLVSTPVALAVDEAFSNVRVISGTYQMQRQAPQPMETRGVVADYRAGRLTVWTSTQVPHVERTVLARTLGMSESDIRVIAPAVGGGFGGKLHVYREDVVVAWLACHLGRPVRWIEDRREHFLASSHARDQRMEMAAALDEDGGIAALRCQITCDVGSGEIMPPGLGPPMV